MNIGDIVTYQEIQGLVPTDQWRQAFYDAQRHMLTNHQRAFECERGVGYRMVHPREQGRLSVRHERRAKRQVKKAVTMVTEVEHDLLTRDERQRIEALEQHHRNLERFMKQLDRRQGKIEARVATTEKDGKAATDRIDRLENLLRRHGISDE
jgi:hypothetical protein